MKKFNLITVLLLGSLSSTLSAEGVSLSGNVGIMSNYIYRGMSQSDDKISAKAGVDAFYNSFYAGATVLAVDFGTDDDFEIDYYAGYRNLLGIFTYDVNLFIVSYDGSSHSSKEVALGLSWPCQVINNLTLGATYAKGIDKAPDNFNLRASYDLKVATLDMNYNDYDTVGKATTIALSKPFNLNGHTINTSLKYTSFSSDNAFIEDQNNLYVSLGVNF